MTAFITSIFAALPNVIMSIFARMFTERLLQSVLEKVVVHALTHLVTLTTNTLDDEIAADMIKQLQGDSDG